MSWLDVNKLLCPKAVLSKEQICSAMLCGSKFLWKDDKKVSVQKSASLHTAAANGICRVGDCWQWNLGRWKTQEELVHEFWIRRITTSNVLLLLLVALKESVKFSLLDQTQPAVGDWLAFDLPGNRTSTSILGQGCERCSAGPGGCKIYSKTI